MTATDPTTLALLSPLWLYFVLVLGIIVLPGMDMAFVMASALVDGRRAGAAAVAGIVVGGAVHTALGGLGVGLVLLQAPNLFNTLLVAGSVYVAWMGWAVWRGASALGDVQAAASRPLWHTFARAVATCLLNPKAYVFMLAVFPQFLRVEQGHMGMQTLALGAITAATQAAVYGSVALGAAALRVWLRTHAQAQVGLGQVVGLVLMATALWALLQGWQGWQR